MSHIDRRRFLAAGGAAAAGAFALPLIAAATPGGRGSATARAAGSPTAGAAGDPTGTTLAEAATPTPGAGYRRLTAGPGWPLEVRTDLADAAPGRADRHTGIGSLVQLTDLHILDAQSPVRVPYVHPLIGSAYRPQETLTTQGLIALVNRINQLRGGPLTGRAFDAVVTTGDNTDNHERIELEWFLTALSGGTLTPDTGDPERYEGPQSTGSPLYWNPEAADPGLFADAGFPVIEGLLDAARRPLSSPGLTTPWYCVFGNHDDSVQGTAPSTELLTGLYTADFTLGIPGSEAQAREMQRALREDPAALPALAAKSTSPKWDITPDPRRAPFTPREFIAAHFDPAYTGPGPVGHGFAPDAAETGIGYYTFRIAEGVTGIAMDSTNRAGFVDGSLGRRQLDWIEQVLTAGSRRYYGPDGRPHTGGDTDELFLLFSHHTSDTMDMLVPDPEDPAESRHSGAELVDLLHRFPNVLGWVNGHTHDNRVIAHRGQTPEQSFWEINTASHIDYPQLARIIEVADNADGTVSLLCTLIEADAPYTADHTDLSPLGLASLYRELAFNDVNTDPDRIGDAGDRNVELLLAHPHR